MVKWKGDWEELEGRGSKTRPIKNRIGSYLPIDMHYARYSSKMTGNKVSVDFLVVVS